MGRRRAGFAQQAQQLRRHQGAERHLVLDELGDKGLAIETPTLHHLAATEQMSQHRHRRNRPQRPHVKQHIANHSAPAHNDVLQHRAQAGMPVHHRLGRTSGAAGVIERGECLG
ncbi:hypothetical protein D3C75_486070 [compost metagenome]